MIANFPLKVATLPDRLTVCLALCRHLEQQDVEYCVLEFESGRPARPSTTEMVVHRTSVARLPLLIQSFCDGSGMELVECMPLANGGLRIRVSALGAEQHPQFLGFDFLTDQYRHGRLLFSAGDVLADRITVEIEGQALSRCHVAVPPKRFIIRLLRCLDAGEIDEYDTDHLTQQWRFDPRSAAGQLSRFWDLTREGGVIIRAGESASWEPVRASMTALRASIAPRRTVWSERALAIREWIGQVLRPSGLFVACLGPDGSGKSSVIAALEAHPLEPFAGVDTMRLRPGVLRRKNLEPMEHATPKKPRGFFGTTAKLTMFAVDYWLGYWLSIRPQLTRSWLVVSDRYYDDVLVDPLRYRILGARLFARVLLPWIPRPHLWFVFDAPADVLASRQSDVPEAESSRLRGEYRRVLRAHESLVLLDARQPVEEVVAQAERAIVSHLARRTARRWGLPVPTTRNPRSSELLLFFCRRQVPVLSRLVRVAFNSDIYCRLPDDIHLPHPYGIVMHPQAVIGHRVTVMQQVTIGSKDPSDNVAPVIGDDVYIGAGARVLGDVRIGNGAVVGANAVVTRDIPAGVTVVGANRILSAQIQKTPGAGDTSVTHFPSQIHRGG